jgi:hypothetical protein
MLFSLVKTQIPAAIVMARRAISLVENSHSPLESGDHVGETKVVAFEKQRLVEAFGQCVGKAITKIQTGAMTTSAVDLEPSLCDLGLGLIERNNPELAPPKKFAHPRLSLGS